MRISDWSSDVCSSDLVSLAVADGAALAQRAADLVATHPSLMRIPDAIVLARRTRKIIRQNLTWALGYNVLALPLAAAGLVRSEEHTSELQSLMRISYAVFCLKKKKLNNHTTQSMQHNTNTDNTTERCTSRSACHAYK